MSETDGMVEAAPQDLVVMRARSEIRGLLGHEGHRGPHGFAGPNRRDGSDGRDGPPGARGRVREREERGALQAPYCI